MFVGKDSFDHKDLLASVMAVQIEMRSGRPPHHCCVLGSKLRQRHDCQSIHCATIPRRLACMDHDPVGIFTIKMPKFDEQGTSTIRKRCMTGAGRVFEVRARAVVPGLVAQYPIKYQNFFAQLVHMRIEPRSGAVSHDSSRPGHFATIAFQYSAVDPG